MTDKTETKKDFLFNRKEQKAIGRFIQMARKLSKKNNEFLPSVINRLQQEHDCYDR